MKRLSDGSTLKGDGKTQAALSVIQEVSDSGDVTRSINNPVAEVLETTEDPYINRIS